MACGLISAFGAGVLAKSGHTAFQIACVLAIAVVLYDAVLKSTILGPVGMASCRFLNLMLGASCAGAANIVWSGPQLDIAVALFVYITGVTWFARYEAGQSSKAGLTAGCLVALSGIGIHIWSASNVAAPQSPGTGATIALALIAANIAWRCKNAIAAGQPVMLQKTVGFMLLNLIFLDAAMTFCMTGSGQLASLVVILVIPATLMKRYIPLS